MTHRPPFGLLVF